MTSASTDLDRAIFLVGHIVGIVVTAPDDHQAIAQIIDALDEAELLSDRLLAQVRERLEAPPPPRGPR